MKFIAFAAAGLIAATALTPVPAEAQRRGYGYDRGHHGWNGGRHWQGNRGHGWRGGNGWRGSRGWRGRSSVRCHYVRGYYGRQSQCYRVYR